MIHEGKEDEPCYKCFVLPVCMKKNCINLVLSCAPMYEHVMEASGIFDCKIHETNLGVNSEKPKHDLFIVTRMYYSHNLKKTMKLIRSISQTKKHGCQIVDYPPAKRHFRKEEII